MRETEHLPTAIINLGAIRRNFQLLGRLLARLHRKDTPAGPGVVPPDRPPTPPAASPVSVDGFRSFSWPSLMPVIKADAYGHGHLEVGRALLDEGASAFASGSVVEAALLRQGLRRSLRQNPALGEATPIVSLLGLVEPHDVELAVEHGIIPVLHCFEQLEPLRAKGMGSRAGAGGGTLAVAIKCNTGMARLGFEPEDLPRLARELASFTRVRPVLALTHLACADTENGAAALDEQAGKFAGMVALLRTNWPELVCSIGNSAGTLLADRATAVLGPHLCRPGYALYGGNPFAGTSLSGLGADLEPAMRVSAPVLAVRTLPAGTSIGYGHAFTAAAPTRVAILGAGYADCLTRSLSNRGQVWIRGTRARILGRISMQMTAVDVSAAPEALPGDRAWILGGPAEEGKRSSPASAASANAPAEGGAPLTPEELAADWGTIPYEVFCLMGNNRREYEE